MRERDFPSFSVKIEFYKRQLFGRLREKGNKILEIGVGTGPNIKYYADTVDVIIGIDPNERMEKYARAMAADAGLAPAQFNFIRGVSMILNSRCLIGPVVWFTLN